jgi:hypothetical protein
MALIYENTSTANGNSDEITWKPHRKEMPLRGTFFAYGTFDTSTVALQVSPDGGTTFIAATDVLGNAISFTANGYANFELYGNGDPIDADQVKLRVNTSSVGGSTSVTARIFDIT